LKDNWKQGEGEEGATHVCDCFSDIHDFAAMDLTMVESSGQWL
jgi:hypothetical protein